tara:strand:- start:112 stop:477 length:366 start_codon:yes stop_codon:yes gene_type:complete
MMKPTHCKYKNFSASGYSGTSEALNPRAKLLSFSIQTNYNQEVDGQYIEFRNGGATGAILMKWEYGVGTSGINSANLYAFNCLIPGGGIAFPDGIYVDFRLLDDDIGGTALTWRVNMVYQA